MMIRVIALALGLIGAATAAAPEYRVTLDQSLTQFSVDVCFQKNAVPRYLWASSDLARDTLSSATQGKDKRALNLRRGRLHLNRKDGRCIAYAVDLEPLTREAGNRNVSRVGDDLLTSSGVWLWRPSPGRDFSLQFNLPRNMAVSAPWKNIGPAANHRFLVSPAMADWSDYVAFGDFQVQPVSIPGSTFRLAVLNGEPEASLTDIATWVGQAGLATASITGHFPLPNPQVLVIPLGRGSGPIPWAQVKRGGGSAAHFFINQEEPLSQFLIDWTPSHEFSHMLHPYLGGSGRWVSEGLASYYQNVSRARSGQLSSQQAWDRLHAGFERGRKSSTRESLASMLERGGGRHNYMRIYWSGAALALQIDVALRLRSNGKQSLDTVLAAFGRCCLPAARSWTPREFMRKLDQLSRTRLFERSYDKARNYPGFPDLDQTFQSLALSERWGRLQYEAGPSEGIVLRNAIMGPSGTADIAGLSTGSD